jgi:DNA-binding GntR family transcriptional regulator
MSSHETMARSHVEHSNIVGAIVEGNAERAYEAMRAHNGRVNVSVLQVLRR